MRCFESSEIQVCTCTSVPVLCVPLLVIWQLCANIHTERDETNIFTKKAKFIYARSINEHSK